MFLGEPAPTQADLHFRLFGFPVRVHPFFWGVTLLLVLGTAKAEPAKAVTWIAVVFVSILVHELGHAFVQRRFGGRPWIVLYSFGGLANCNDCDRSPRSQIMISLAGPMAGFLLAAVLMLGIWLTGRWVAFILFGQAVFFSPDGVILRELPRFVLIDAAAEPFASPAIDTVINDLLYVNILWGAVNLLPIYPLDGGHVARELLTLRHPRRGIVQSLQLSIVAAALVALYAVVEKSIFLCVMFGLLAYGSYQALRAYRDHWN